MASAKENVRVAPQPLPRQTTTISSSSPRPPSPPLRPNKMANGGATTEPPPVSGVLKCTCFRLPSRTKKQPLPPHPAKTKLRSASCRSAVAPEVPAALASQSQRVTFRASSASLSAWWSPQQPATSAGATANPPAPAAGRSGGSFVVAPRRASASAAVTASPMKAAGAASTPSLSHWRCRSLSRVMPHGRGERVSFSFNVSPASASSSCMSTPKIPQGWQHK